MNKFRQLPLIFLLALLSLSGLALPSVVGQAAVAAPSQKAGASEILELELDSKLMGREMPYRVVLPTGYKERSAVSSRYPVIYLLHGLTGHYKDWTDKTKIAEYNSRFDFIIVTPEGDNGWYTDSASKSTEKYESYIVKELIPQVDAKFRTLADREHRIIAGLSMGGYGGLKFGLKYPEMFSLAGSFSGALTAPDLDAEIPADTPATTFFGIIRSSVIAAFGPKDAEGRKSNDIYKLVRDLRPEKLKDLPFLYESCGTEDALIASNRAFMSLLAERKIPHEYREHPGRHDWVFWDDQIREFMMVADRHVKNKI